MVVKMAFDAEDGVWQPYLGGDIDISTARNHAKSFNDKNAE